LIRKTTTIDVATVDFPAETAIPVVDKLVQVADRFVELVEDKPVLEDKPAEDKPAEDKLVLEDKLFQIVDKLVLDKVDMVPVVVDKLCLEHKLFQIVDKLVLDKVLLVVDNMADKVHLDSLDKARYGKFVQGLQTTSASSLTLDSKIVL